MFVELLRDVSIGPVSEDPARISGRTISGLESVGNRWNWTLRLPTVDLIVWETLWVSGERELVLANQEVDPRLPLALSKLMSRRRAGLESADNFDFMSARRVDPDADGWPKHSNCRASDLVELIPPRTEEVLSDIGYLGCSTREETLGASGPNRNQLIGRFRPESRTATTGFYALTRVIPTLRHTRILEVL